MGISKQANYLNISLIVVILLLQNLHAQTKIRVIDLNGNGIYHCHLFSSVNKFAFDSDDSGFIEITKPFESDSFLFRHINFKSKSIFIAKETSNHTIRLDFDTIQFSEFVVKRVNCSESKNSKINRTYGYEIEKRKSRFGDCAVVDLRTKIARSFLLESSCGNLTEISFFVPKFPEINKNIQSYYNLNFYIVTKDSVFNIPSWKLISTVDLKKIKYGWNKITINDCNFKTKQITIGIDVTLKSNDSLNSALLISNNGEFPLYIRSENKGESNSFIYIDYTLNKLPSKGWSNLNRSIAIKIKTIEYE